jgi:hypothetical protein
LLSPPKDDWQGRSAVSLGLLNGVTTETGLAFWQHELLTERGCSPKRPERI